MNKILLLGYSMRGGFVFSSSHNFADFMSSQRAKNIFENYFFVIKVTQIFSKKGHFLKSHIFAVVEQILAMGPGDHSTH